MTAESPIAIISPISDAQEVDMLLDAGATEFYCGVLPSDWTTRHGELAWTNRRGPGKANLSSFEDLDALLKKAHARNAIVKAAMNTPAYFGEELEAAVQLCMALEKAGLDGLIVSDVALILALKERGLRVPITLSSVASIHSAEACRFFQDLGVSSVVLPRHVSLDEIQTLRDALPDLPLEVFVLNDGCVYEEGHCATTHALGAICATPWEYRFGRVDGQPLTAQEQARLESNIQDYREWSWNTNDCGCSYSPRGLPNGPCALCALEPLARMGVRRFKIVGREAIPYRKMRSVQLVRAIVEQLEQGASAESCQETAISIRATPELCATGYMCYYREACTVARATLRASAGDEDPGLLPDPIVPSGLPLVGI